MAKKNIKMDRNHRGNFFFRIRCCCYCCLCPFHFINDHDHDHDPKYQNNFQSNSHVKNLDRSDDPITKKMIFRFPFTNHAHNSNNDNTSSSMNLSCRMREQKSSSLKLFNRNKDLMIDHHRQQQQCRAYDEIKSRTRNSMMLDQDNSIGCLHNHLGAFNQTKSSCTMDNRNFHFQITMVNE